MPPLALCLPQHWPIWLGIGAWSLLERLPVALKQPLSHALAIVLWFASARQRRHVMTNLRLCFADKTPTERRDLAKAYYRTYARSLLDLPLCWWSSPQRLRQCVALEGEAYLRQCQQRQQGVILLVAHQLCLEQSAQILALNFPLIGYVKPFKNPVFDWLTTRSRTRFGSALTPRGASMKSLIKNIRQGDFIYYLADEDLGESVSEFTPFFGQQKATLTSLGRLARLAQAPIVPVSMRFDEALQRYVVSLQPPLLDLPSGDNQQDARLLNQWLEQLISEHPEQYLWKLRLFKTRPEGQKSVYQTARKTPYF